MRDRYCCRSLGGQVVKAKKAPKLQPPPTTEAPDLYADQLTGRLGSLHASSSSSRHSNRITYTHKKIGHYPMLSRALYARQLPRRSNRAFENEDNDAEDDQSTGVAKGFCGYDEVCCVIPERSSSKGCETCGLKGNGERKMQKQPDAPPPRPLPQRPRAVTQAPKIVERSLDWSAGVRRAHRLKMRPYGMYGRSLRYRRSPQTQKYWSERIVRGTTADRNEYCWQVSVIFSGRL